MRTLKITLTALFSFGLLTAVLPSSEIDSVNDNSNNEVKHAKSKLTDSVYRDKGNHFPENG